MPENTETETPHATELSRLEAGLDALETSGRQKASVQSVIGRAIAPLAAIAVIILIWQFIFWSGWQPDYIIPSPGQVWDALANQSAQDILWQATWNSIFRAAKGFILALIIATPIGLALGLNRTLRALFRPILTGLQQLPSVAWVPAAIIWFGLSDATIYTVILLGAVPSISIGLINGIDQTPPLYLRAGKVLGAKGFNRIYHIVLPAAWPGYLAGLEQGWAFAWRSLMAAELIAVSPALGPGLGQMLDTGRTLGDMALVLGSIAMIMAVGVLVERVFFSPIRQRTLRDRGLVVR